MEYLKKLSRFIIPYKKYGYLNIFFNILYAFFSTLAMVSLMPMINVLFGETEKVTVKPVYQGITHLKAYGEAFLNYFVTTTNANEGPQRTLFYMIVLIISLFLLKNIFNYLALFSITFLRNGVLKDLRNAIYDKVITLPISYYSEKKKGDIIARISGDVNEVKNSLLAILELIVKEPLTIVFAIITMFTISSKLTIFVFLFIPVAGFIISRIGKSLKRKSNKVQTEQGVFISTLEETLGGLKVIKGFNAEQKFNDKFQDSTNRFYHFSNTLLNRQNLASPTSEFLGIVTIAALLWYGGSMVLIEKTLSGGAFITYMALAYQILTPAKDISKASYKVKAGNAAADRVLEILNTESVLEDKPNAKVKSDFTSDISLNNISFKYDDEMVLKHFTLKVPKGKSVALVGQSGSGKSTIANLVTRFYDVNQGTITIDGDDIKDLTKQSLRSLMGLVTQDSILFNDTIKNNILLGKENATDEEIIDALKIANAWEFVKDLPLGIETNIGDSGNKLSGGQKQRLSIARAVLKNPPIMILDEATSALDTESERLVQDALENMMKNRTSIVIAHRLSTIQSADLIVVMQKGEIVEQGTHDELIKKDNVYNKLVHMQSFE
ncbi:ABC transporter ATP-binding protein [Formosa algae]|uniref:Subfamily B ATP-binding cassette protein MsbA n=1 Tax=Formosa algae TaxID=225843 RepID=A0A9X0YPP2_9FLAO|nr:ABC transporter ATP-binding protein [Formosa algae]MBP1841409.1 subfamily B ATP-binding cassette protein MsbA [Formosa algae]MDQ0336669.1 subfamily B ATP-binding cassette protein MsbA [Formosa algae]OEI81871.1 antibiotic ABC transporter ATP-binding protein [Formosa algae]PNW28581.1 antibiotic ABC transporter ATP-binding protein [Formosa algae]